MLRMFAGALQASLELRAIPVSLEPLETLASQASAIFLM